MTKTGINPGVHEMCIKIHSLSKLLPSEINKINDMGIYFIYIYTYLLFSQFCTKKSLLILLKKSTLLFINHSLLNANPASLVLEFDDNGFEISFFFFEAESESSSLFLFLLSVFSVFSDFNCLAFCNHSYYRCKKAMN